MNKKFFASYLSLAIISFGFIIFSHHAQAALDPGPIKDALGTQIPTNGSILDIAINVMTWVLGATGSFAVIMIVIGGFRYVSSAGNEDLAEAAKETITKAVIGLVIVLLAYVIVATIDSAIGSSGGGSTAGSGATGGMSTGTTGGQSTGSNPCGLNGPCILPY